MKNKIFLIFSFITCFLFLNQRSEAQTSVQDGFAAWATVVNDPTIVSGNYKFRINQFQGNPKKYNEQYILSDLTAGDIVFSNTCSRFVVVSRTLDTLVVSDPDPGNSVLPSAGEKIGFTREFNVNGYKFAAIPQSGDGAGGPILGVTNSLAACMNTHYSKNLSNARDITKYIGSGVPAFTPTSDEPKLAQGLASPYPFYAYNGSAWVLVGSGGSSADTSYYKIVTRDDVNRVFIKGVDKGLKITNKADTAQVAGFDFPSMDFRTENVVNSDLIPIYDGTNHVKIRVDSLKSLNTTTNGLSKVGGDIVLGGTLTKPTEIATATQSLSITGTGSLNVGTNTDNTGRVNITQTADSAAIVITSIDIPLKPILLFKTTSGTEKARLTLDYNNMFFGASAGLNNVRVSGTQGESNMGIGLGAMQSNVGGYAMTAIGLGALNQYTGGTGGVTNSGHVAIGYQSLFNLLTGVGNTALGTDAGYGFTSGDYNTILGYHSGGKVGATLAGSQNTFLGASVAVQMGTTAGENTATGYQSAFNLTTGIQNTYYGKNSGFAATIANSVSAFGYGALASNTSNDNTAIGHNAATTNTSGTGITAIGKSALLSNSTGINNTAVGHRSAEANSTGAENTIIGAFAGLSNSTGGSNTFIGAQAGTSNGTGTGSTFIGRQAGLSSTADNNLGIGYRSTFLTTTGTNNTAIGTLSLYNNILGGNNVAIGMESLYGAVGANLQDNISIGYRALFNSTTGKGNMGIGTRAMIGNTSGYSNVAIGDSCLSISTTAYKNVAIGSKAGDIVTTGSNNTFIGAASNVSTGAGAIENSTAIGFQSKVGASNSIVLGAVNSAYSPNIGINITTPQYKLDIDAKTGSGGNPLRLQGVLQGSASDSIATLSSGIMKQLSIAQVINAGVVTQTASPADGATVTIAAITTRLLLQPSSLLSTLTIAFPSSPTDGQKLRISVGSPGGIASGSAAVTTTTWSNGTIYGATPVLLTGGDTVDFQWDSANNVWRRIIL